MIVAFVGCGFCGLLFLVSYTLWMLIVSSSLLFCLSYIGYSTMYAMVAENYPTVSRNTAVGIANGANKLGGVVSPLLFGLLLTLDGGFYLVLLSAAAGFVIIGLLGLYTTETKGLNIDEEEQEDKYSRISMGQKRTVSEINASGLF